MRMIVVISWVIVSVLIYSYNHSIGSNTEKKLYSVGLLIVATGKYIDFIQPLINSARTYFLPNHKVTFFIFTDGALAPQNDVVIIPHTRQGWPYDTLMRFHVYRKNAHHYAQCDYLFSCDADMIFNDYVGDEILANRVATQHSNYLFDTPPYETNPFSTACIHHAAGKHYFAGAFYGGTQQSFNELLNVVTQAIETDLARGVIARVNDESYLNKYFSCYEPTKMLSPSYCHFVHWSSPYPRKLLAIDDKVATIRPCNTINPLRYYENLKLTNA